MCNPRFHSFASPCGGPCHLCAQIFLRAASWPVRHRGQPHFGAGKQKVPSASPRAGNWWPAATQQLQLRFASTPEIATPSSPAQAMESLPVGCLIMSPFTADLLTLGAAYEDRVMEHHQQNPICRSETSPQHGSMQEKRSSEHHNCEWQPRQAIALSLEGL